ncbi:DUF5658 family protein [Neobacillus endophyticus]|uniref:DUF5658 family protein n=1 Tax=Neobacillus endophyticus TaxID=2738405 RepID=UPI001C276B21|nr:DUF5658 family protein [Neobacillus endophyticus]
MRLCLFLLLAGILDAILTQFGIVSGFINEGNPVMSFIIEKSWSYFYLVKILLPLLLIGLYYIQPLKGKSKALLISACVLYFSVLVLHMGWILLYFKHSA